MSELLHLARTGPDGVVARVTLRRPQVRNAFNAELIAALHAAFAQLSVEPAERLRAVVIAGEGPAFSAGADIAWQRAAMRLSLEENEADAEKLRAMLAAIDECPAPVVARAHGAVVGGGMGLCSVADIVLATRDAVFGFTETKLGILPAVISPFVLARIGPGPARALFLTGERFGAEHAREIGLVHDVLLDERTLDERLDAVLADLLAAGPTAVRQAKGLIRAWAGMGRDDFARHAVAVAAAQRVSDEGQEGLGAFLDKRTPSWRR